jgi:tetratricopeptide (TPR) repeat protein/transcriptional regulator with XRE-family HTH domain
MTTGSAQSFGDLLRRQRLAAGLTQEKLAELAGLSVRGLSDLERGARRVPRRETVQLLAKALHLSAAERTQLEAAVRKPGVPVAQPPGGAASANRAANLPLVGRAQELALLEQVLTDGPPVLLVAGEPGIGKSRLLQAGIERAQALGWTALTGSCHRRSGQEPYAPLLGALADFLRRQSPADQRRQVQGCSWLVRLLPELAESGVVSRPPWTLPAEQERRLMFAAVARYLVNVAGPAGTLLVLDDLHWAGPDALDLLQALVRTPADRPLRLLVAYRDTDVMSQDPLAFLVADLAREGRATRAQLSPLEVAEATALLAELLPVTAEADPHLRQQVLARAGGVPLFLVSCVQALFTGHLTWNGASHVPWTLREAILQRVVALQEVAQQVLRMAAVVGSRVPRTLLVAVAARADLAEEVVLEALEGCCRARLLGEGGEDAYQFTHDLIREVLLTDLGTARRTLLHRRVAEVLETMIPAPAISVLAYHFARSDEQDKAILYLEWAGDAARARYAHAEAASDYHEAITRLESLGRRAQAAAVSEKSGMMLALQAHYDEALVTLERAGEVYRVESDLEGELRALAQIGRIHRWRGTSQEGLIRLLPLVHRLPKTSASRGAAAFHVALAYLYKGAGQYSEQLAAAEHAVTLARASGDDSLLTTAQERRASALLALGRLEETCRTLTDEVIPASEATGNLWTLITAHDNLAGAYEFLGDYQQARASLEQAIALDERLGDPAEMAYLLYGRGLNAFALGEWKRALPDFERAATLVGSTGQFWYAPYPPYGLGQLCLAEGREEEAAHYFMQALTLAERNHDLQALCCIQGTLADWDMLAGRPEAARGRLAPLLDAPGLTVSYSRESLSLLAWAYLEMGEADQAQALLAQVLHTARQARMGPTLVLALRVHALVLSEQERWEEAENALQEALILCRGMATPYVEAKTLYAAGLVSRKNREFEPARQRFEAALEICTRLGEHLYARHIEQLLGQGNTSQQDLTLASSQQLDARGACERESVSRSPRPSETSSRHISIDSPPGQASGPGRRG